MADSSSTPFGTGGNRLTSYNPKQALANKRNEQERRKAAGKFAVGDWVLVGGRLKGKVVKVTGTSVRVRVGLGRPQAYSPSALTKVQK
jgi:hypothetical protein